MRTSPPVRLVIPTIGLSTRLAPVGLTNKGHMQMPDPSVAGWYRLGPPGVQGPTVLVGHVDSRHGPAVFYRLSGARPGETVRLVRADGSQARFIISKVTVVSKARFPSRAVFDPTARATIRLITCTGRFNPDTGYADSLIVWGHATPS
jgi:sortase (surface protein transpeptidase)